MYDDHEREAGLRVGELATASKVTVRTLHHYEAIGLLVAASRSEAGHRRYSAADVERLYRICALQRLGLSLADIGVALDDDSWNLRSTIATQLIDVERRIGAAQQLRTRLTRLLDATAATTHPPTTDVLDVLEDMNMLNQPVRRRISILVYRDLDAAFLYLTRVFGLGPGDLSRDGDGRAVHGEIEAGDGVIWLHPESEEFQLASPATVGAATATMAVMVDDVDAHHAHAVSEGAAIVYPPTDQPYGYREYSARDQEGALWSFMKALQE
jgi:MerR family transcriptional regulator, thiopeptide resistance regulator